MAWIGLAARDGRFNAWLGEEEKNCQIRICDWTLIVVGSGWWNHAVFHVTVIAAHWRE